MAQSKVGVLNDCLTLLRKRDEAERRLNHLKTTETLEVSKIYYKMGNSETVLTCYDTAMKPSDLGQSVKYALIGELEKTIKRIDTAINENIMFKKEVE